MSSTTSPLPAPLPLIRFCGAPGCRHRARPGGLGIEYDLLVVTPQERASRAAASTFWRDVIAEAKLVYAA